MKNYLFIFIVMAVLAAGCNSPGNTPSNSTDDTVTNVDTPRILHDTIWHDTIPTVKPAPNSKMPVKRIDSLKKYL